MMTAKEFNDLPEWRKIREVLIERIAEHTDKCLQFAGSQQAIADAAKAIAFRDVLNLPVELFPADEADDHPLTKEESVSGILITNRPIGDLY